MCTHFQKPNRTKFVLVLILNSTFEQDDLYCPTIFHSAINYQEDTSLFSWMKAYFYSLKNGLHISKLRSRFMYEVNFSKDFSVLIPFLPLSLPYTHTVKSFCCVISHKEERNMTEERKNKDNLGTVILFFQI